MKKKIKKIMSLILVITIFFGLATIASADLTSTSKGKIVVNGVEDTVEVSAYRLINVFYSDEAQQPVSPVYEWIDAVKPWIENNYPEFNRATDFNDHYVESHLEFNIDEFYDKLAAAIKGGEINVVPQTRTGSGEIADLIMGNYLILIENGLKVYRPSAVNLIPAWNEETEQWEMTKAVVNVKASSPTITKTSTNLDKVSNKIGGKVPFEIKSDVPVYPKNSLSKVYNLSDNLPEGLTLNRNSIKVYGIMGTVENELTEGTHYTLTVENNGFKVAFDYDNLKDNNKVYESVKVAYDTTVNEKAMVGEANTNNATLEYTKNPYKTETNYVTATSKTDVYTYGLKVTKIGDKDEHINGLPGAEFVLNTNADNKENLIEFVKEEDGVYRVALDTDTDTVTTLETDNNGNLTIKGLSLGTYYLWETKAPGGYNKPKKPVKLEIVDNDMNGKPEYANSENQTVEATDGYVPATIKNTSGIMLPETGGIGTIIFTALGVVLMGVGAVVFVRTQKKEQ